MAEFIRTNLDPNDPDSPAPPDNEIRAFARLFRFVELRGSDLPSLPKLGTWPSPDPQTARVALLERFSSAQMPTTLIESWKDEHSAFRQRLQAFFVQLDRLLPYPELTDAAHIDMAAKHWKVDRATALEKLSVSVALEDEPWLTFLSVLCLRSFSDLVPSLPDCFPLVKLAAGRVHGQRADLLKLMSRNAWLAAEYGISKELFAHAQVLFADDVAQTSSQLRQLAELATALAAVVRGGSPPKPDVEHAIRKLMLITPESLRAQRSYRYLKR